MLSSAAAFLVLATSHSIAALQSPIQDCDETFNFWEPSHYLNHGYGMQTWELSPEFAIRSWLYTGLHSVAISGMAIMTRSGNKESEFYNLRILLGLIGAACETRLFSVISRSMNRRIALVFLIVCMFSPGFFHSTVSYLPSSFAMCTLALALADFMDTRNSSRIARGLTWLGLGSTIGWPFVAVLCVPFVIEKLGLSWVNRTKTATLVHLGYGLAQSIGILICQVIVDSLFYRKLTIVPLNIVLYNVLTRSGKGPNIYGTEPWHFYFRNLLINFNIWFVLACLSAPMHLVHRALRSRSSSKTALLQTLVVLSPFYLWLAIFTLQPHKEERFMYPVYPSLALNAAISSYTIVSILTSPSRKSLFSFVPMRLRQLAVLGMLLFAVTVGICRIAGLVTAYSGPLKIYRGLSHDPFVSHNPDRIFHICLGKEWYRFPSSYHIPSNVRLRFIRSDFNGLLPGTFSEANSSHGFYPGTWQIPRGMNDKNVEDPGKYVELTQCDFLVDLSAPGLTASKLEPDFLNKTSVWEQADCVRFLDAASTRTPGRIFWIPEMDFVPVKWRRVWGRYCLLKRKSME